MLKEIKMFTRRLFNLSIMVALLIAACTPQVAATPAEDKPVTLRFAVADAEGRASDPYVRT